MAKFKKDIAVIGAGPVGLFTVFEAGMLGLSTIVIDALEFIGGQCAALYPEKPIYDIPAYPSILAQELIEQLRLQAAPFKPEFLLNNQVTEFEEHKDFIILRTSQGHVIECKSLIIAAGSGAFGPNRPPLGGIEEYEGKSIHYMVQNKSQFAGHEIAIAGGGDSAIDWAIELANIAKKVYLIHRRDNFRAAPQSMQKIEALVAAGKIELTVPYQLHALKGADGALHALEVVDLKGQVRELQVSHLLAFFGLSMKLGPILDWGLNIEKNHIHVLPECNETNISRVFAVGDICSYPRKLKLILTGFAEVAKACYKAYEYIHPEKPLHFEYSTTKGVPE